MTNQKLTVTHSVSSAQFVRDFGEYKNIARREPVTITDHGRETHVMIAIEEFTRLKALDNRRAYHPAELPDDLAQALEATRAPASASKHDHELDD